MRFAQLDSGKVTAVVDGVEYKILPPNCVELTEKTTVKPGDIYEDGVFRAATTADVLKEFRPSFNTKRDRLFAETAWARERHSDHKERGIDDLKNWTAWQTYWQALRDMPAQVGFNAQYPKWPVMPE